MVQAFGITYRIVSLGDVHRVIRIIDDQCVGAFSCRQGLQIVDCQIDVPTLRRIANAALRAARVSWSPLEVSPGRAATVETATNAHIVRPKRDAANETRSEVARSSTTNARQRPTRKRSSSWLSALGGLWFAVLGYAMACDVPEPQTPERVVPVTTRDARETDGGAPPVAPPPLYGDRVVRTREPTRRMARE